MNNCLWILLGLSLFLGESVVGCLSFDSSTELCRSQDDCLGCEDCYLGSCVNVDGVCCDDDRVIKPDTEVCQSGTNYRCFGVGCGADIQSQKWKKYCDGKNRKCEGVVAESEWELETDCGATALCFEQQGVKPICFVCDDVCIDGACKDCAFGLGACCDETNHFVGKGTKCARWTEYRCLDSCGANREYRVVERVLREFR